MKRDVELIMPILAFLSVFSAASALGGGLMADGSQLWPDFNAEENDNFGMSVCTGDFNGDGYDDLVGGCPNEDFTGADFAGAVYVVYGSASGLPPSAAERQYLNQGDLVFGELEARDAFGWSLASGDFDNDGYDDLAIGAPEENVGEIINAGAVNVVYGSAAGLNTERVQHWIQDSDWIHGSCEAHDYFGWSLASGDFNRDGYADLAVGAPQEDLGAIVDAGEVHVIYGGPSGLGIERHASQDFDQLVAGVPGDAETGDMFGYSLAAGAFNGDGFVDDLAIGSPFEDVPYDTVNRENAGVVTILYGGVGGLSTSGADMISRNTHGPGNPTEGDRFGMHLAAGKDGGLSLRCLLAIGIPGSDIDQPGYEQSNCGAILVLRSSAEGIYDGQYQYIQGLFDQDSTGFGNSFAIGDLDGDPYVDLLAGGNRYDANDERDAGVIYATHGRQTGLFWGYIYMYDLDSPGIAGEGAAQNEFGYSVALGDFNGDGLDDAAVGVPQYEYYGQPGAGAISIIYSTESIWNQSVNLGGGWRYSDWFGYFNNGNEPWIRHLQHGWLYYFGDDIRAVTFWDSGMGAMWWTSRNRYPYAHRFSDASWLWYLEGSKDPRWFVNLGTGVWEEH